MNFLEKSIGVIITVLFFFSVVSCEQQKGPAEKAGKKIDAAVVETGKKIDAAVVKTGKKIEETGKELQKPTPKKSE